MSQPWQQPPSDNPYAATPPGGQASPGQAQPSGPPPGYGPAQAAAQAPAGGPMPAFGPPPQGDGMPQPGPGGYPPPVAPIPRRPERTGLGVLAGIGAALVAVFVYAAILRFTNHEIGYVALAVGLIVGVAMGKVGGPAPALPILGVVISLLAVWFGQLTGMAWAISHQDPALSFGWIFFQNFSGLAQDWQHNFVDARDILFFAIAGAEGFVVTRRTGNS